MACKGSTLRRRESFADFMYSYGLYLIMMLTGIGPGCNVDIEVSRHGSQMANGSEAVDVCSHFRSFIRENREPNRIFNLRSLRSMVEGANSPTTLSQLFERMNIEGLLGKSWKSDEVILSTVNNPVPYWSEMALSAIVLIPSTQSIQLASAQTPRIIGSNTSGDFFFALEGSERPAEQLEWIQFHCDPGNVHFEFGVVTSIGNRLRVLSSDNPLDTLPTQDGTQRTVREVCGNCHGKISLRPNFHGYPLWPAALGANDARSGSASRNDFNTFASHFIESRIAEQLVERVRGDVSKYRRYVPILSHLLDTKFVQLSNQTVRDHDIYTLLHKQVSGFSLRVGRALQTMRLDQIVEFIKKHVDLNERRKLIALLDEIDKSSNNMKLDASGLPLPLQEFLFGKGVKRYKDSSRDSFCGKSWYTWQQKVREYHNSLETLYPMVEQNAGVDILSEIDSTLTADNGTSTFCVQDGEWFYFADLLKQIASDRGLELPTDDWFAVRRPMKDGVDQEPIQFELNSEEIPTPFTDADKSFRTVLRSALGQKEAKADDSCDGSKK